MNKDKLKSAFLTDVGREALDEIIKYCDAKETPKRTDNVNEQFYALGRQSVGQELLKIKEKIYEPS